MTEITEAVAPSLINAEPAPAASTATPLANTAVVPPAAGVTPAADGKTTEGQDASKTGDAAKVGAPEQYAPFTLKEGLEVNTASMERFLPVAKELNLTQEQAQKLVDLQSEFVLESAKAEQDAWDTMQAEWVNAAKTDKEIGGVAFTDNVSFAAKAIKQFGSPELKAALDATGVGNHPEFIRVFAKIGKAISEDKFHISNADAPPTPKTWAERLFPNQGKQE